MPGARTFTVLDDDTSPRTWPSGLNTLGPDDGTAVCALLRGCREATVVDGDHALTFTWNSTSGPDLCSLLLWRNSAAGRPQRHTDQSVSNPWWAA